MTRLFNAPTGFAQEMLSGFIHAHSARVRGVPGGAIRRGYTALGKVAVVIGGGSGHYPAFAGLVGPGLADAAVVGDIFASPSTRQVVGVCRAAERAAGVLLSFGNYAGDVLNFTAAAERLRSSGVPVEIVAVTDDIASAPADQAALRRGVAGDLVIFKVAGAAAERGDPLARVAAVARRANAVTRSLGIAFGGCTLPGATAPLFTVPEGRMAIGLGIHGEPGVSEEKFESADQVARILVDRLLAERPNDSPARVVALLNGLGSTKHEELFVLWHGIRRLLDEAEIDIAEVEVGELCTSLDMEGLSLTFAWLDDELLELWRDPADAPAFRVGYPSPPIPDPDGVRDVSEAAIVVGAASAASRGDARVISAALERVCVDLAANETRLGDLDAVAGDGDHGRGMVRGAKAAADAARDVVTRGAGARTTLLAAAEAWGDRAGGTSGALWGAALAAASGRLSDHEGADLTHLVDAVASAVDAVQTAGGAEIGDKTLLDAMIPFCRTLAARIEAKSDLAVAWQDAITAAEDGAQATSAVPARRGRSRALGDKSIGTPDPGAVSFVIVASAIMAAIEEIQ